MADHPDWRSDPLQRLLPHGNWRYVLGRIAIAGPSNAYRLQKASGDKYRLKSIQGALSAMSERGLLRRIKGTSRGHDYELTVVGSVLAALLLPEYDALTEKALLDRVGVLRRGAEDESAEGKFLLRLLDAAALPDREAAERGAVLPLFQASVADAVLSFVMLSRIIPDPSVGPLPLNATNFLEFLRPRIHSETGRAKFYLGCALVALAEAGLLDETIKELSGALQGVKELKTEVVALKRYVLWGLKRRPSAPPPFGRSSARRRPGTAGARASSG